MRKIDLVPDEILQSKNFAEKVLPTLSYLENRNQENKELIKQQIVIGKLGEIATRKWFLMNEIPCNEVDFTVTVEKTYNPDLIINEKTPCHVKSQSEESADSYGVSWTFQYSGKGTGHTDHEIFDNSNKEAVIVFCIVHDTFVNIWCMLLVQDLHELKLFKEPKRKELHEVKKVVYVGDIPRKFWVD